MIMKDREISQVTSKEYDFVFNKPVCLLFLIYDEQASLYAHY
jgi:hypothetical protein